LTRFHYTAYGLTIESAIQCPDLLPGGNRPDVTIRYGDVPTALENPRDRGVLFQLQPGRFLLQLDDIARYLVSGGQEIVVDQVPDSDKDAVRLFLLGSAMGALLHQRGLLVLHGSAIETPRGAVIFVGPSGNGKSTLAAAFCRRGYRLVADDVCAVTLNEQNAPMVLPAYPQLKLWADVVKRLDREQDELRRVRPHLEKYALPLPDNFVAHALPLHAVYALHPTNTQTLEMQVREGMARFTVLTRNTYRERFLAGLDMKPTHFQLASTTAKQIRVCQVTRPSWPFMLDELVEMLEQDFRAQSDHG
jgi:hypothetical protein